MQPSPLRLAVFDCDGTLVDSQSSILQAMFAACDCHGFARPSERDVRRVVGLPLEVAVQTLLEGVSADFALEISASYKSAFRDLRQAGRVREPLFPGMEGVLDRLDMAGWVLGVATGKAMRGLKNTLDHHKMMDRFVTLQTADTAQGKPHPEMMLKALAATGVEPAHAVMIGDTTFDMEMAKNAYVKAIGVAWGYHEIEELMDAGAVQVVHSADELTAALFKEGGAA